jgi:glycine oxidase
VETADIVIAGAGIIGLSLALDLAASGLQVIVVERGRAMAEASWAAAGMLAANDPENPPQLAELARLSISLYPSYLSGIERLSGKKVPLRTRAALQALPRAAAAHRARRLSRAELLALVPDLHDGGRDFLSLDESSLDPRDLCAALPLAAVAAGVRLLEESAVVSVEGFAAGVTVETTARTLSAAHFVNCAGAWAESPALGRLPVGHPRIAPRKGQMTTVRLRGRESLPHVLRTPDIYLVPRGDGRVTVGATVEDAAFDKTVEPRAIAGLLQTAAGLWPPIAHAEILESWAGLRPGSGDDLPLIGPTAEPNRWIAAGHFRNGILLAPGTAHALSQEIRGELPEIDLAPFDPGRSDSRPLDRIGPPASDNAATAAL